MGQKRIRNVPAGVLPQPHPETFGTLPNGNTVPYMFCPDKTNGILWLDERAGLGVLGAATALMNKGNKNSWYIERVSHQLLKRLKKNPRLRASTAERISMARVA